MCRTRPRVITAIKSLARSSGAHVKTLRVIASATEPDSASAPDWASAATTSRSDRRPTIAPVSSSTTSAPIPSLFIRSIEVRRPAPGQTVATSAALVTQDLHDLHRVSLDCEVTASVWACPAGLSSRLSQHRQARPGVGAGQPAQRRLVDVAGHRTATSRIHRVGSHHLDILRCRLERDDRYAASTKSQRFGVEQRPRPSPHDRCRPGSALAGPRHRRTDDDQVEVLADQHIGVRG